MDSQLIDVLVCPSCKGPLTKRPQDGYFCCKTEKLAFPVRDGIPIMLLEQAEHFAEPADASNPLQP